MDSTAKQGLTWLVQRCTIQLFVLHGTDLASTLNGIQKGRTQELRDLWRDNVAEVCWQVLGELRAGHVDEAPHLFAADGVEQDWRGLGEHDVAVVGHRELDVTEDDANKERWVMHLPGRIGATASEDRDAIIGKCLSRQLEYGEPHEMGTERAGWALHLVICQRLAKA